MAYDILNKYFDLSSSNLNQEEFLLFEKYSLIFSSEYKRIQNSISTFKSIHIHFMIELPIEDKKIHYYSSIKLYTLIEAYENLILLKDNEVEALNWYQGFSSYNAEGLLPVASLTGNSDINELFLNCNEFDNGSIYVLDRMITYNLNCEGNPVKKRIANSISHLLEIAESQKDQIPKEYLIT